MKVASYNKILCFLIAKGNFSSSSNLELYEIIEKLWRNYVIANMMLVIADMSLIVKIMWKLIINKKKDILKHAAKRLDENTR